MKRFITKALSRYLKLITLSFAFILYHCARSGGFSLSCRDIGAFYYILDKGDFGGGYLWQVCSGLFSFIFVIFCVDLYVGCLLAETLSYVIAATWSTRSARYVSIYCCLLPPIHKALTYLYLLLSLVNYTEYGLCNRLILVTSAFSWKFLVFLFTVFHVLLNVRVRMCDYNKRLNSSRSVSGLN